LEGWGKRGVEVSKKKQNNATQEEKKGLKEPVSGLMVEINCPKRTSGNRMIGGKKGRVDQSGRKANRHE